jgi:hypothetical protein
MSVSLGSKRRYHVALGDTALKHIACLVVFFILLSNVGIAQVASVSQIETAGGFLDVCGPSETQLSAAQAEALKKAPPSEMPEALYRQMDNRLAEVAMCFGFLGGLSEGWKEGHEHGVIAAQFPEAWPNDEKKALSGLPLKQLQAVTAAMNTDVPCFPDHVTLGQERDIVVKFIRKNPFITIAPTRRVVWLAFQEAFPCPAHSPQTSPPPDSVK